MFRLLFGNTTIWRRNRKSAAFHCFPSCFRSWIRPSEWPSWPPGAWYT